MKWSFDSGIFNKAPERKEENKAMRTNPVPLTYEHPTGPEMNSEPTEPHEYTPEERRQRRRRTLKNHLVEGVANAFTFGCGGYGGNF
jgi:hypothetical protein